MAQKIDEYLIGPTLGEGGFSVVKLGVHETTKEKVALKILKNKHKLDENTKKQVMREVHAMSKINHENVLRMKKVVWDATYTKKSGKKLPVILIVLELATGGELFEFLSFTGLFEETLARTYMKQFLSGLHHCHTSGIAHRDLKPENLLLDADFRLKIADFGFSNIITETQKVMYTECGTPGYMPPEMFSHKGYDGRVGDVWSAGVILFIMLAGFPPFQRPATSDWWFNKLANGKQHLFWAAHCRNARFSDSCKDLIEKMLTTDPSKRITLPELAAHKWLSGPVMSSETLKGELTKRKAKIDAIKQREKEEKEAEEVEVAGDGSVWRSGGGETKVDPDKDDLPPASTQMSVGGFVFQKPTFAASSVEAALLEGDDFDDSAPSVVQEREMHVFDPSIVRYTRFTSKKDPATILRRLAEVAEARKGKYEESDEEFSIRISTKMGVTVNAEILSTDTEGSYVVDFTRVKGESAEARKLYSSLRAEVSDLL